MGNEGCFTPRASVSVERSWGIPGWSGGGTEHRAEGQGEGGGMADSGHPPHFLWKTVSVLEKLRLDIKVCQKSKQVFGFKNSVFKNTTSLCHSYIYSSHSEPSSLHNG